MKDGRTMIVAQTVLLSKVNIERVNLRLRVAKGWESNGKAHEVIQLKGDVMRHTTQILRKIRLLRN